MLIRNLKSRKARRGVALVEAAAVYPVFILLLMGTISLGLGAFRRAQISHLAGEAARWASVRGETYQQDQKEPAPTNDDVLQFLQARMPGMVPETLTAELSMESDRTTVTLRYPWTPDLVDLGIGSIEFVSTASAPITY